MSKKEKDIKKGFPLGIKINVEEVISDTMIDELIALTKCYHDDKYVIGLDTLYCTKPHYHIHFYAAKDTTADAMKTFRSEKIKKNFPHISRSFRFYTGKDYTDVDPQLWIAYCIKEKLVKTSGHSITDEVKIQAASQLQVKQMKNVHSQKKSIDEKEKKDFKEKMLEYVFQNYTAYVKDNNLDGKKSASYGETCITAVRRLLIKYLRDEGKFGSLKKHFIQQYILEYCCKYSNFDEKDIETFLGF